MSEIWSTIAVLAVATAAIRASGPIAVGGRALSPALLRVIALLAPSLLAALVVVETFAGADRSVELDPRALGVAAAAVVLGFRRDAMLTAVVVAAAVAAIARAVF
jgi:branched-subunit amino acid transport protein